MKKEKPREVIEIKLAILVEKLKEEGDDNFDDYDRGSLWTLFDVYKRCYKNPKTLEELIEKYK